MGCCLLGLLTRGDVSSVPSMFHRDKLCVLSLVNGFLRTQYMCVSCFSLLLSLSP